MKYMISESIHEGSTIIAMMVLDSSRLGASRTSNQVDLVMLVASVVINQDRKFILAFLFLGIH